MRRLWGSAAGLGFAVLTIVGCEADKTEPEVRELEEPATLPAEERAPELGMEEPALEERPEGAQVIVEQPPAEVEVQQPAPTVTVQQPPPEVEVTQPEPEVEVLQPRPDVEVTQPGEPQVVYEEVGEPEVEVQRPAAEGAQPPRDLEEEAAEPAQRAAQPSQEQHAALRQDLKQMQDEVRQMKQKLQKMPAEMRTPYEGAIGRLEQRASLLERDIDRIGQETGEAANRLIQQVQRQLGDMRQSLERVQKGMPDADAPSGAGAEPRAPEGAPQAPAPGQ